MPQDDHPHTLFDSQSDSQKAKRAERLAEEAERLRLRVDFFRRGGRIKRFPKGHVGPDWRGLKSAWGLHLGSLADKVKSALKKKDKE